MKIIKNYLYNSSYQLFLIILPIITLPYLSRILGPTYMGINSYTYSIINYFILIAVLGTTTYGQREIAYLKNDWFKISHLFWEIEILNVITTVISYAILSIVIISSGKYQIFLWAYSISVIANVFDVSWLFMGLENFSALALRNFFVKIISVIMIFTFVKNENDLFIYILINSLSILVSNLLLWPYVKKWKIFIGIKDFKRLHPFSHLKGTVALFIPQISITLYTVLDKVLLGYMGDIKGASYFDNSDKIVRLTFTLLTSASTVLMPMIATEISKRNLKKMNGVLKKSLSFSLCISIALFAGIIGVSDKFVPLFLGSQFDEVKIILKLQAFILIPMSIANVVGNQYLIPSRKSKQLNVSIISGSILNVIVSIPLISMDGAFGASISAMLSESVVTITQLWQVRKSLTFKGINSDIAKYLIAAIIMFLFLYFEQMFIPGWISIIIGVLLGSVIYFSILIILKATIVDFAYRILINKLKS
ncbi:polysaccharide biosynthesis C-terminal domain-containing protein [Companilactobacillus kimchiensis]|uniref:PST family polysaccharide transporter n=1 Tax=Companilactobacillus kimchiensis TaxID=993692 RepID=A0A0R2LEJ2_9LACO|nr:polysaccharide biosynthesis C-terminal domain-containing protein [Companilactobacillus kimchiensis]KRO00389.1 PST family polysaccharide transporter [Companilactobacillus kimchiensis]